MGVNFQGWAGLILEEKMVNNGKGTGNISLELYKDNVKENENYYSRSGHILGSNVQTCS